MGKVITGLGGWSLEVHGVECFFPHKLNRALREEGVKGN